MRASSVNASLTIRGASGVVDAETVNGRLELTGGSFQEARLQTVNGSVRFDGELPTTATLDVETVNGAVELRLPASLSADVSISSFQGDVDSDFEMELQPGPRAGTRRAREDQKKTGRRGRDDDHDHDDEHGKSTELRFTTGTGGAKIQVTTLNGGITLRKR